MDAVCPDCGADPMVGYRSCWTCHSILTAAWNRLTGGLFDIPIEELVRRLRRMLFELITEESA